MFFSLLKVAFLSITLSIGSFANNSEIHQPCNEITQKVNKKQRSYGSSNDIQIKVSDMSSLYTDFVWDDTYAFNEDDMEDSNYPYFNWTVGSTDYTGKISILWYYQTSNTYQVKLSVFDSSFVQYDVWINFLNFKVYVDNVNTYQRQTPTYFGFSGGISYIQEFYDYLISKMVTVITPSQLNNYKFSGLADYLNEFVVGGVFQQYIRASQETSIADVSYASDGYLWWRTLSGYLNTKFFLNDFNSYKKGLFYNFDIFGDYQNSLVLQFYDSDFYVGFTSYLQGDYVDNNVKVVLPLTDINLHGVLNEQRPFFENTWNLNIDNKYYIFQGQFRNNEGKYFSDIYFRVKSACEMWVLNDEGEYYQIPSNTGSTLVPTYVYIEGLYGTDSDGLEVCFITHNPLSLKVLGTTVNLMRVILTDGWYWTFYSETPNVLNIINYNKYGSYTTYLTGINTDNGYKAIFNSLFQNTAYYQVDTVSGDYNGTFTPIDVFPLINYGLVGLTGFFAIEILPSITIGMLILTPLVISIILMVISLFKR